MSNDSNDSLTGIFDEITPDMFALESSALHEEEGRYVGLDAFNVFTDEGIRSLRVAFASANGQLNPIAILVNATTRRHFTVEQDENLGMFLERLKREAVLMGPHWLFIAKKNVFAFWYPENELEDDEAREDVTSTAAMQRAMTEGEGQRLGILWYAERREGSEVHHRHGALSIEDNRITDATEGDDKQTLGVFSLILDAVRR